MAIITGHFWSFVKILENQVAFPQVVLAAKAGSLYWKQEMPVLTAVVMGTSGELQKHLLLYLHCKNNAKTLSLM